MDEASPYMKEGIRLMQSGDVEGAILQFDRALALRRQLPPDVPMNAYGLAACWLNRAEALTCLGPDFRTLTLDAYDEALKLLRSLPPGEDARFPRRLAIALQNRALLTQSASDLEEAIAVLGSADDSLLPAMLLNLANMQQSEEPARRTLELVKTEEHKDVAAAEIGIKARHVLCQILSGKLAAMTNVHDATDLVEEGLALIREWEQRGVSLFRDLSADLFRFGAQVYAQHQPHFLEEFLNEQQSS